MEPEINQGPGRPSPWIVLIPFSYIWRLLFGKKPTTKKEVEK